MEMHKGSMMGATAFAIHLIDENDAVVDGFPDAAHGN